MNWLSNDEIRQSIASPFMEMRACKSKSAVINAENTVDLCDLINDFVGTAARRLLMTRDSGIFMVIAGSIKLCAHGAIPRKQEAFIYRLSKEAATVDR